MKKIAKIIVLAALLVIHFGCSQEEEPEIIEFVFNGQFNERTFDFSNHSLLLERSVLNPTGEILHGQRSRFGNPIPAEGEQGIEFQFSFMGQPSFDKIEQFVGQKILVSTEQRPFLNIIIFNNGEIIKSDSGESTNDTFEIYDVFIVENEELNYSGFETGRVIGMNGSLKIEADENVIEGTFTLKLVEVFQ